VKVIVAGSRTIRDAAAVRAAVEDSGFLRDATEIFHGGARGVDSVAHDLFDGVLPVQVFPAEWSKHGRAAGPVRNRQMAECADALVLVWDGRSPGSANMKAEMRRLGKPVFERIISGGEP
jgi:hypothetical protein